MRVALLLAASLLAVAASVRAQPKTHELSVWVIHASKTVHQIDKKLLRLGKELEALKYTRYVLKDEANFKLEAGSRGRMQLPSKDWMDVVVITLTDSDMLRVSIAVEKLDFKATVAIAQDATVVVPGPKFADGVFLLAVTRGQVKPED
jgi:hypothetical protein